jgi:hypothetical protein
MSNSDGFLILYDLLTLATGEHPEKSLHGVSEDPVYGAHSSLTNPPFSIKKP